MSDDTYLEELARGLTQRRPDAIKAVVSVIAEIFVIIIDVSGSMLSKCGLVYRLRAAQRAVLGMFDARIQLGFDDEVVLIAFNDQAWVALPLTRCREHRKEIWRAVNSLAAEGGTDLKAPLVRLGQLNLPPGACVHAVLLSDGHGGNPIRAARALKEAGVIIETVGVGNDPSEVDEDVMKKVASVLDGRILYRFLTDPQALADYFRTEIAGRLVERGSP